MVQVSFIFTCIAYDCQVWPLTWCNLKKPVTRGGFPLVVMPCTELVLSLFVCLFFCYVIWVCWIPPVCLEIHVEFYWQCGSVCKTTLSCLPLLMNAVGYILLPHLYTCIFFIWLMLKLNKEGHVCFLKSDTVFRLSARGGIHYLFTTMCNMMRDNNQY